MALIVKKSILPSEKTETAAN